MKKKLSQKEREEVVTKGYLSDVLEERNYITKDYFEEHLESTINKALEKQSKEFYQHMEALMEHQMNQLQVFMEHMDEQYVLRREWVAQRGF
jgi:hypothetical protein